MSILNTSLSGMLSNTNWLTAIAQNVANANTTGYKNVQTYFSALVNSSQNFESQFSGVSTTSRAMNSLQGQNMQTSSTTDLAVQGAGFFLVSNSNSNIYLTRNGSFVPDAAGNLVNAAGYYLMGTPVAQQGVALNSLSGLVKINIASGGDASIASTAATLTANLPSNTAAVAGPTPASNSPSSQFTAETSLVAYDNLGSPNTINVYFTKTATGTWEATAYDASAAAAGGGFPYSSGPLTTQTLTFNPNNGKLSSGSPMILTVPNGQTLTINLGQTTQLASNFAVTSVNINGNAPGTITDVSVGQDGTLSFNYGNGSSTPVYKVPLAKVASPDNLNSVLGDAFQANPVSGAPQVGIAGTGGLGTINSNALEQSTVDLATELSNMVEAQSSYEANSKVFQAGAKILQVLNNIQA